MPNLSDALSYFTYNKIIKAMIITSYVKGCMWKHATSISGLVLVSSAMFALAACLHIFVWHLHILPDLFCTGLAALSVGHMLYTKQTKV